MTIEADTRLVKVMKLTTVQFDKLARKILEGLKGANAVELQAPEEKILKRAAQILASEFQREADLDKEVNRMLDDLEKSNPGEFQRYKMFVMLKKRLAKEKGIIL